MLKPRYILLSLFLIAALGLSLPLETTTYLVGDSTMSEKRITRYPETGWGMPFSFYFEEGVKVENHALNGRSTRTFIEEGRWDPILEKLSPGDYVFVQFGHNDEVETKPRYTTPEDYQMYLRKYVAETRAKGATPILLTPITRRRFDEQGKQVETHKHYSELMREVAESEGVFLIDMDRKSQALLNELGPEKSKLLFLQLEPGQNPNYPEGVTDNTHFSETGARMMAELVLTGIRELKLELADKIIKGEG